MVTAKEDFCLESAIHLLSPLEPRGSEFSGLNLIMLEIEDEVGS